MNEVAKEFKAKHDILQHYKTFSFALISNMKKRNLDDISNMFSTIKYLKSQVKLFNLHHCYELQ